MAIKRKVKDNMKKYLILGFIALASLASQASYLYWQVRPTDISDIAYSADPAIIVNHATLWAVNNSSGEAKDIDYVVVDPKASPSMSPTITDLGDYGSDAYSFYIEVSNYGTTANPNWSDRIVLAQGEMVRYEDLLTKQYIQVDHLTSQPNLWTGTPFNVPEPTSAMMILLGLAGLALRRKVIA